MAGKTQLRSDRWRDWAMVVLAVWLFLSPWILGASTMTVEGAAASGFSAAAWNAWIVAIVIGAVAVWAALQFAEWHDWVNGVLGVWLIIAPWVLSFSAMAAAAWNHVIIGLLVLALAAWELRVVRHEGHRATA